MKLLDKAETKEDGKVLSMPESTLKDSQSISNESISLSMKQGIPTISYTQDNSMSSDSRESGDEEMDMEISQKIDSLSHPLSSELLSQLENETGDDIKHLYKAQSIRNESESRLLSDELNTPEPLLRKRSNSRTSSGTRTVRNSAKISPASKIFRNLLILEDDLRRQARDQKRLRWQYTSFYSILMGIAGFVVYELYFTTDFVPPEQIYHWPGTHQNNNNNSSRSLYLFMLQLTLVFVISTVFLFYISGQYRRTIILPRRFFNSTNKGIKEFNLRLVKVHSSWDENFTDLVRFISENVALIQLWILHRIFKSNDNAVIQFWNNVKIRSQPRIGAIDVKLVLNPRAFSAEVREGWEIYRDEFWAREGARRRKEHPSSNSDKTTSKS
ncbi:hypothetical protein MOSE0_D01442 [Monosporozyma servazzii]